MRNERLACCVLVAVVMLMAVGPATAGKDRSGSGGKGTTAGEQRVMKVAHLRLHGSIRESQDVWSLLGEGSMATTSQWLERLAQAGRDEQIDAVALEVDMADLSISAAMELAGAIGRLDAIKPVYTYISVGDFPQYVVASAGRKVYMDPSGELSMVGLAVEMGFFKGTMDKWGLTPQFVQAGQYKGAAEPYMDTGPSAQLRAEIDRLLDDLYGGLCRALSRHRRIPVKMVRQAIDAGPLRAAEARRYRLVDGLVGRQQWLSELAGRLGQSGPIHVIYGYGRAGRQTVSANPMAVLSMLMGGGKSQPVKDDTVAVITAEGLIVPGTSGTGLLGMPLVGHRTLAKAFAWAQKEPKVKAVVFRINSPGGSALASEWIYQAVKECARVKPVVVSITGMGASGGYYIAMGGQVIYAAPMAVVGSIGVVAGRVSFTGFLEGQRVAMHSWTRGRHAGLLLSRPWTEEELQVIGRQVDKTYLQFTTRVADARGKKIGDITRVAEGRIFAAERAVKVGLVDRVGGLDEALAEAARRGGIEGQAHYLLLPRPKTLLQWLQGEEEQVRSMAGGLAMEQAVLRRVAGGLAGAGQLTRLAYLVESANLLNRETVMLALPYCLTLRY